MAEAFPVSGNIDPKTFPFLLGDLHRQGATGSLKVDGPSYTKSLYFRGGRILFGSSGDPKDQLGAILIESGKITEEQLGEVNTKVGPGNPLAKVLAESGFVNQRELSEAARIKVERILSDVISYTAGSFEFEDGVLPKGAVDLKLSTEKLVLAAVARLSDRSFVLRHLDSLGVVLAPTPEMGEKMAELRPEAGDLPERLDGHRTLKEAASLTRLDEFEAAKVACALLFLGLAERSGPVEGAGAGEELDLAQTARMALDGSGPVPVVRAAPEEERPEPAFFVPEAPPAGEDAIDITMPDSPAPRFEQPETPPLGMPMTSPPGSPGIREEPEHVGVLPEPEPASEPVGFSFSMPEERPMADLGLEPPKTEVLDRRPPPPVAVPPPSPPPAPPEPVAVPGPPPEASVPPPFAFEEEAPREAVAPSRPSKEDLAALDALLNPSASMRSTSVPAPRPRAERWDPQFRPAPISRPSRRQRSFPVVPVALAAALVVGSGAAAWYFYGRPPQAAPSPKPLARPTPRSVVPTATAAAASPAPVQTTPSPEAASATAPPPTAAPATPPPTAPPVVAVTPTPAPAPAAGGMAEASQLLERRDYPGAARAFVASIRTTPQARYSVQLLVACADETVDKALANASAPELFILPVSYKGRSCYRLCWGLYDSEARADTALSSVPAYFREGGAKPKVAATSVLLP